jgi:hypothetical protein
MAVGRVTRFRQGYGVESWNQGAYHGVGRGRGVGRGLGVALGVGVGLTLGDGAAVGVGVGASPWQELLLRNAPKAQGEGR